MASFTFAANPDPCAGLPTLETTEVGTDVFYKIGTADDLYSFACMVNNGGASINGMLTADIVVNENLLGTDNANVDEDGSFNVQAYKTANGAEPRAWTPIGTDEYFPYTGTFTGKDAEGNVHTISGLYCNFNYGNIGLNLGAVNFAYNAAKVRDECSDPARCNADYEGGIVGTSRGGTVGNAYNNEGVFAGMAIGNPEGEASFTNVENKSDDAFTDGTVLALLNNGRTNVWMEDPTTHYPVPNMSYSAEPELVNGVYQIATFDNLLWFADAVNKGNTTISAKLTADIVLNANLLGENNANVNEDGSFNISKYGSEPKSWTPIGTDEKPFIGTFDGNGKTVSGLYFNGEYYVGGVVGYNDNGTVSNGFFNTEVTCENCDVVEDTTGMSSAKFADGTVAMLLHGWCEMDGGVCKYGGLNGSIWGQDLTKENSLPDFSGVVGFKYGSITFFNLNDDVADSANIDATAKAPVSITSDIVVTGPITFKRPFAVGYSTMMLPFSVNAENKPAELEFYSFDKVEENNGKYTASYNPVKASSGLNAHTPYIVKNSGEDALSQVTFEGEFTLGTSDMPPANSSSSAWKFNGTYEYKTWEEGDAGLGRTYGFAANDGVNDPSIVGKFAKIAAGAYIYPMRAYLEYTAPAALARPAANGVAANTVASLPDEIDVVIVDKDEKNGEQTTRAIGKLDTRTGEFKFATDRWFDLNGRYLGNKKPAQKGAYYNNGKKVIVK